MTTESKDETAYEKHYFKRWPGTEEIIILDTYDLEDFFLAGIAHERERAKGLIEALTEITRHKESIRSELELRWKYESDARLALAKYRGEI